MGDDSQVKDYRRVEEIAQLFGLTARRIQQLTQDGVLKTESCEVDGRKVRRYDLLPTVQKYVQYLSDRAYGKKGSSEREIMLREQKMEADIALKESQGELHRLKTAIASGDYISIEEVRLDYAKFFVTFKKFAMSIPARVGGTLMNMLDPVEVRKIEKDMAAEITVLLKSFVIAGVVEPKEVKGINNARARTEEVEKEVPGN